MAKSKNYTEFQMEDGRMVSFDQPAFRFAFNEKVNEIKRKNGKKKVNRDELFGMIAEGMSRLSNEDPESIKGRIKNWYRGYNGPGRLEDIYALADILECENKEEFLKEVKKDEEENMKVSDAGVVNVNFDHSKIIRAMWRMREREAAYELYSAFVDLMGNYLKVDMDVWLNYEEGTPEWEAALAKLPRRISAECALQKAKMYLSEDTMYGAYNLLETMYGPKAFDGEEPCDFRYDINYLLSEFRSVRLELYREHLDCMGIKKEIGNNYRDDDWTDFMMELNRSWWDRLEDAFTELIS